MYRQFQVFFEDIDQSLKNDFDDIFITFKVIGFVALSLAGLPERGTKDVDMLITKQIEAIPDSPPKNAFDFLKKEFGKDSPGAIRHGVYLDFVAKNIPWLPPRPRFIFEQKLHHLELLRLDPIDTCVAKTFSNFKHKNDRAQDKNDILDSLDNRIITFEEYIHRLDEALPHYEAHAEAAEVFPRVMEFIEILQDEYGLAKLTYELPSWMENM